MARKGKQKHKSYPLRPPFRFLTPLKLYKSKRLIRYLVTNERKSKRRGIKTNRALQKRKRLTNHIRSNRRYFIQTKRC